MITNEQFDLAAREVRSNPMALLPVMIDYKNFIQRAIIPMLTTSELADIRDSRLNDVVITKLCKLAKQKWLSKADATTLYCAAMAVATIVKEYEWGMQYLVGDGLWTMAQRIIDADSIA